jgi:hypothetical protein
MTNKKIEEYRKRLVEKWNLPDKEESKRELKKLADELGASGCKIYLSGGAASRGELSDYIQNALQTASMIDVCQTSAKNYKIAITAAIIALLSALAAWAAVLASRGMGL